MKKWILRISVSILGFFLLLLSGIFFLLGTQNGTSIIVSQVEKQMNGQLQIHSATGTLLDRLVLTDLLFDSPIGKATLGKLVLDWKSSDLLRFHFHIVEFTADDIMYSAIPQSQETKPESTTPLTLPELSLPITISIEKLAVKNVHFSSSADARPLTIQHAALALLWDNTGIQLQELGLKIPEAKLQAQGKILPTGNYPLKLTTEIKTLSPEYPSLTLHGQYRGDLQELRIKETLRGDIEADLQGTIHDIVNALAWNVDLQIKELQLGTFSPEVPGILSGNLTSRGTLQQTGVTAQLAVRDEEELYGNLDADLDIEANLDSLLVKIKKCNLQHAESSASIDLSGTVDQKQQLDIALNWQRLQWPVTGDADYMSPAGTVKLTGTVEDFHLLLETNVSGGEIPEAAIQLTSDGNTENIRNVQLTANTLEGSLKTAGKVEWTPAVKWQLSSEAQHLNPGVHFPDWPGTIDWKIISKGRIEDSGIFANMTIKDLQGTLRNLPLAGTGNIEITPETIQIDNLHLSSGEASIAAQGKLGDTSDLQWDVSITDFADLLPDGGGQLNGSGTVLGKMASPQLTAQLSGDAITVPQMELGQFQVNANLDLGWQNPFEVDLTALNINLGEDKSQQIQEISLQSNGHLKQHTARLFASHELADITLSLKGSYDQEQWQGTMASILLDSKDMGKWQNTKPAKLFAGAKAANLQSLCLNRESSNVCTSGTWNQENMNTGGELSVTDFPIGWLSAWFPQNLEDLGGSLSLTADATMNDTLKADIQAKITPGKISYVTDIEKGQLSHEGGKLDVKIADNGLNADLWLSVDSNVISGKMQSPDLLDKKSKNSPSLAGKVHIDAKNFQLVEKMLSDIQNVDAQIDTNFTIQGTVAEPQIDGEGKLSITKILIPVAGLELSDTTLDILADNSALKVNGSFNSPEGSMMLDGELLIDAANNYPAHIALNGKNFRLVNLPEIKVFITSNLLLEKKNELSQLTGEITIPKADILLRELPKGAETVSPDVQIVQEIKKEETKSPLQMKLKVSLGNKVHFVGMGLNAFIDGQMSIVAEPEEQMLGSGELHIKQGTYRIYGQDLDINTGTISFPGGPLTQPGINLRASRSIGEIKAGIYVIGPARKPRITTFSVPPMSESLTLSYLITGSAPKDASAGSMLSVGRQINNKLSVSVGSNTKTGESEFKTKYRLNRKIHVQTTTGTHSNAADVFYTIELGGEEKKREENED